MTMGGRSAATEVAKSAPVSAAAATDATPKVFMIVQMVYDMKKMPSLMGMLKERSK